MTESTDRAMGPGNECRDDKGVGVCRRCEMQDAKPWAVGEFGEGSD